jgi:K+/H+ antiporter YhaU regulatory subunit KhtT
MLKLKLIRLEKEKEKIEYSIQQPKKVKMNVAKSKEENGKRIGNNDILQNTNKLYNRTLE